MKPKFAIRHSLILMAASSLLATSSSHAATLYWDGATPAGDPDGGLGTWDTSLFNWDTALLAGSAAQWVNANLDTAVFGVTAGTVTLGTSIDVGGLQFNTTGYGITTTGFSLNFADTVNPNTILFNNIAAATITGPVGGAGNVILSRSNPATAGILTLNGTSTGGWTGSTTINAGMTMSLSGLNQALKDTTTSITLNGGGITLTNASDAEAGLDRVNNSASIISNGGNITVTNTASATRVYAETMGELDLRGGQLNVVTTNANTADVATQTLTFGSGSLTDVNEAARTNATTSAINFSGASLGANVRNSIIITGQATTALNEIIAPWATVGTTAGTQTDYAVYNRAGSAGSTNSLGIQTANIAGTAQTAWTTAANAYTMSANQTLTGTRTITALRNATGAGGTLTLASGANLETYGLLSGTQTLAVNIGTGGVLTTPTGGGNLFITTGGANITVTAPINNNGGNVTLVKGGGSTLTLSSTTSNFSGGIVLNAGTLTFNNNLNLGSGGGITVNGTASINGSDVYNYARTLTLNEGGALSLGNGFGVTGVFSGNGALNVTSADGFVFSNAANNFTGAITSATAGTLTYGLEFASIGDTAGAGLINLVGGSGTFRWTSASGGTTTLANRQFALSSPGAVGASMTTISALGTTAASNLVISKDLLVTGTAGARALRLAGTNLGNNTFAGIIADGTEGGASVVTIVKDQAGLWILSNDNTYTGSTIINASGGTLQIGAGGTTGSISNSGSITLTGGTLAFNRSDNLVQGTDFATGISGAAGGLTKLGAGDLTLNSANTFGGLTTVTAGRILMTHALALQNSAYNTTGSNGSTIGLDVTSGLSSGKLTLGGLSGGVNLASAITAGYTTPLTNLTLNPQTGVSVTYTGTIAGATTGMSLTKTGAGAQILNGGSSFTGGVTINSGALTFGVAQGFTGGIIINGGDLRLASSGTTLLGSNVVTFAGSGSVNAGGVSGGGTFVLPSVVVNSGTATFGFVGSAAKTYTFTNGLSGSGDLTFSGGTTGPGNNKNVNLNNASGFTGTLSLNWSVDSGTNSNLNLSGLGDGGKLILNPGGNGRRNLNITYTGAAQTFNTRQIELGSTFGGVGMIINSNGSGPLVFNTALSVTASGAKPLVLSGTTTGINNAFNGQIVDGLGTINLVKSGVSTWNVTNSSNNYTGGTTVNGGTLGFASGALGTVGGINASGGTLLWLSGNTQDISSRLAMTLGTTSTFDTNGNDVIFATAIGNSTTAALTKSGVGTLTLSNTNTYTGATTISAGTLLINGNQSAAIGAVAVNGTSTLGGSGTIGGNVTVAATAKLAPGNSAAGTLNLTGNLIFTVTSSDVGTLDFELGANNALSSDRISVNGTLNIGTAALDLNDFIFTNLGGLENGTYPLISTGNAIAGTLGPVTNGTLGAATIVLQKSGDGTDIELVVSGIVGGSVYDDWALAKGLDGTAGKEAGKTDDPDGDGKNNLYEFAFDGDPLSGANDGKIVGKIATVGGEQVMTLTLPVRTGAVFSNSSGDELSALIDGIHYRIEGDVDLSTFADDVTEVPAGAELTAIQAGLPGLSATPGAGWTYRTFRAPGTVPTTPKAFLRAKISETP
jgi:autotransporter-associated beta strand protein